MSNLTLSPVRPPISAFPAPLSPITFASSPVSPPQINKRRREAGDSSEFVPQMAQALISGIPSPARSPLSSPRGSSNKSPPPMGGRSRLRKEWAQGDDDAAQGPGFGLARSIGGVSAMPAILRGGRRVQDPLIQKIQDIYSKCVLKKADEEFRILSIAGAKGEHSQVYTISGLTQFIPGVENAKIIVKLFQERVIENEGSHGIKRFMRTLLTQYQEIKDHLPVTKIYNSETALTDGFLIAEKVTPFRVQWDKETSVADLQALHQLRLNEFKKFIDFASTQVTNIPLDLHRNNFGINSRDELVLLDFMEHEEDDTPDNLAIPGYAFSLIKNNRIASLANGNPHVERFLKGEPL